jgi:hypothetical protein
MTSVDSDITFEEFKQAVIKWNKNTTTLPSEQQLGHYKLLSKLSIFEENNEQVNISDIILQQYIT